MDGYFTSSILAVSILPVKLKGPSLPMITGDRSGWCKEDWTSQYQLKQTHWLKESGELPNLLVLAGLGHVLQSIGK
jgi:hypothetical protein